MIKQERSNIQGRSKFLGHTRVSQYYEYMELEERTNMEAEITRKCLTRNDDQNELAILEFIHNLVETLDRYFSNVCELDIMFNLDRVHMILDEMIVNGQIVETNKNRILAPVAIFDKAAN
ncbi:uncharacterized protein LOC141889254 isoform X3 [Acropora palmata]|uniref:uncharacterized protein LOC141889254 isoform X3 n=1 Tax=Acropora palmata TaxID=6131 RepID=UPI003DA06794